MKAIFQTALKNSMSYNDYLRLMDDMAAQKKSTGHEQNEMLTDFTKLNQARMKRLDKTQKLLPEAVDTMKKIREKQTWLILTESWCGDAAQNVPVLKKMADENLLIDIRLVLRDDNDDLMQKFLTNGGRSIPKLIAIAENNLSELFTWGPRPQKANDMVKAMIAEQGGITDEVKTAVQLWYNKDKGIEVQKEMIELLSSL